jgi:hypothetical protein
VAKPWQKMTIVKPMLVYLLDPYQLSVVVMEGFFSVGNAVGGPISFFYPHETDINCGMS